MPTIYEQIAEVYQATYGEPLVADWAWVEPLFNTCEIAVACDWDLTVEEFTAGAQHAEVIARTAAVIAVMTHGTKVVA